MVVGMSGASDRLRADIVNYLKAHHVMTLATSAEDAPWAVGVFYASHDFTIYFLSDPESRHCANVKRNPAASAAIHLTLMRSDHVSNPSRQFTCWSVVNTKGVGRG